MILNPVLKLVDYQILKLKIESDYMSKWYYKLTKILSVRKDIDYIMCIDENGSSSNLTYVLKQISNEKELSELCDLLDEMLSNNTDFLKRRINFLKVMSV